MSDVHDLGEVEAQGPADFAEHIAAALKSSNPHADVRVTPSTIPPHVAGNLLEFLRRVECKGMEAIAWVEAYTFVQQHAPQSPQGVPFGGLPNKK